MRTGIADLPLHPGRCPAWLFERMRPLAREISQIIIDEYGTRELLLRLSDPMFFQALGCVLAFDWHSSGLTTTTCGALKEALAQNDVVAVAGGKGKASRKAPEEIENKAEAFGLDEEKLKKASFLSAKIDSSCIQDGYSLYHHCFFFDEKGNWAVIQQGMNNANSYARRYHWFSTENFVDAPPENIAGQKREEKVLNLVSAVSEDARETSVDVVRDNPSRLRKYFDGQTILFDSDGASLTMPQRHEILECDLTKKDWELLNQAYELQPQNYEELLCLRGMGGRKLRALALVSKLIYGSELDWSDPVKYCWAHGSKDGYPFPVDRPSYDHTIEFLKNAIQQSKLGQKEKSMPLQCLSNS